MSSTPQPQYISLQEWAKARYPGKVPHVNTLRRWAKSGMIVPAPFLQGREYKVVPTARHISEPVPGRSLVDRLRQDGFAPA
jgi:hypothetical protein